MELKDLVRETPDFPKPGILFRDISPIFKDPAATAELIFGMAATWNGKATGVVGLDARGFIIGSLLAQALWLPFAMARKKGKLPGQVASISYGLEYGEDILELQVDAFEPGSKVLIVDDLLATGGTADAASKLVTMIGSEVAGYAFVIELAGLNGRQKLCGAPIASVLTY